MTDLSYFAGFGRMTHPGAVAGLCDHLPADADALRRVVQGLVLHVFWASRYGVQLAPDRQAELQLRALEPRLARTLELDDRPLDAARPPERRIVGNCRDFSVTLAGLLQSKGIPARPRCGFATYFQPNHFEDHWVCEYWNAADQRWVLVDAQLDELQCGVLQPDFDPRDVPRERFLSGGAAWRLCRSGQADPDSFGIFDMRGLGFVRGNLVRDTAALNKMELLPWDCWGVILSERLDDPADLAMLDELASLTGAGVPDFEAVQALYTADPRLRVGESILSYVNGAMREVRLG